jgi:hypothetical protein
MSFTLQKYIHVITLVWDKGRELNVIVKVKLGGLTQRHTQQTCIKPAKIQNHVLKDLGEVMEDDPNVSNFLLQGCALNALRR